jgi:hypothetical protein
MEQYRLDLLKEACDLKVDVQGIDSNGDYFEDHELDEKDARLAFLISQMNPRELKGYNLIVEQVLETTIELRRQNRYAQIAYYDLVEEFRDTIGLLIGKG